MRKGCLLFTINSKSRLYGLTENNYSAIQPNICMGLLDSYLESKGIEVQMIDETYNYSIPDMVSIIEKEQPLLFGVICSGANPSSSTMSMVGAINFFKELNGRKLNSKGFIQGGHPSVLPERTLQETGVDFVIRGEGYLTIEQLYQSLLGNNDYSKIKGLAFYKDNQYIDTGFGDLVKVNILPRVNWEKLNPNKYKCHNWHGFEDINNRSPYGVLWTSFGCPHSCSFCCINNVFGKRSYRLRDMKLVLEEIDLLVTQYGVKNIKIMDELFIIKHPRIEEFYQGLKKRKYDLNIWAYARMDSVTPEILEKLRSVGVKWVAYGIESINDNILVDVIKDYDVKFYDRVIDMTKKVDIAICADIIAGLWLDSKETLEETYQWCVSKNFEWLNIYPAFAYPGTNMCKEYISKGRMEVPKNWEAYALYGYNCSPLKSKHISSKEILEWRDSKFLQYHNRPEYLDMIEKKYSKETREHIVEMTKHKLSRKILEERK